MDYNGSNKKCMLYNNSLNTSLSTISPDDNVFPKSNIILTDDFLNNYDYLCNFLKIKENGKYIPNPNIGDLNNWGSGKIYSVKANAIINDYITTINNLTQTTSSNPTFSSLQTTGSNQKIVPVMNSTIALQELYNNLRNKIIINYLIKNENLYKDTGNDKISSNKGDTACNCLNGIYGDNMKLHPKTDSNPIKNPTNQQTASISEFLKI